MRSRAAFPGRWILVTTPDDLAAALERTEPRYIFLPHWSHLVASEIVNRFECVCFHMTDLPYGRGGSPLQNLISRGHTETMLTALRMTEDIDAGPVYAKRPLSLEGSAAEIFDRAGDIVCELTGWIANNEPVPAPQTGEPMHFRRRKPAESLLPATDEPAQIYDHIRMLDAPGYPKAYLEHGQWRLVFDDAHLDGAEVRARVTFTRAEQEPR
jgi:methionyl-tRNA formyltransferase